MKSEFKFICLAAAVLTATAVLPGCTKKEAVLDQKEAITEANLTPASQQPGAVTSGLNASDPKTWSFLPENIAEINGKAVSKKEFILKFAEEFPNGVMPAQITADMLKGMAYNIVKSYVDKKIILAAAEKNGLKPGKEAIVAELKKQIATIPPQELEILKKELEKQKKTIDSYVDEIASSSANQESYVIETYLNKEVVSKISISEAEAKKYYDANINMFKTRPDPADVVRASHILIEARKDAKPEDIAAAEKKAADILAQVKKDPAKFAEIAQKESACPSRNQGGSLGAFSKGQMVKEFENVAFTLKEGEISGLVKTDFGFHIIRRDPAKKSEIIAFDNVKVNLINQLKNEAVARAVSDLINKLEKENNVKFFVKPAAPVMMPVPAPAAN